MNRTINHNKVYNSFFVFVNLVSVRWTEWSMWTSYPDGHNTYDPYAKFGPWPSSNDLNQRICSMPCETGYEARLRECDEPKYGGRWECPGIGHYKRTCNKDPCPRKWPKHQNPSPYMNATYATHHSPLHPKEKHILLLLYYFLITCCRDLENNNKDQRSGVTCTNDGVE